MDLEKVEAVIRPAIEGSGFQLYDIEFSGRILRVTIDKPDGVGINDCADVSRLLNPLLDVEELVPGGKYELEVSSPGLDRALRRPEHFQSVMGKRIHVTTLRSLGDWNKVDSPEDRFFETRKNFKGELLSVDGDLIKISTEGREALIPLKMISKAYVDFELKTTPKKGKKV